MARSKFDFHLLTDSASFVGGYGEYQIARLLRAAADRIERGHFDGELRDDNGNIVGRFVWRE